MNANEAIAIAKGLLDTDLPRRWAHTQGVAERAKTLAGLLGGDSQTVEVAAWLHDIGYAPALVSTHLHALDGARYLRDVVQADDVICQLVAHHTAASVEAEERGMPILSEEFQQPPAALLQALTYCDLTAGVDGRPTDVDQRIEEILTRYPAGHVVHRSITRSGPSLRAAAHDIQGRLAAVTEVAADQSKYGVFARCR